MNKEAIWARAEALVGQMTLDEAASQLRYDAPAIKRLGIPAYNWWNEALHGVARAGTATVYPQAIGLAAMFDGEETRAIADEISTEARAKYNAQSALGDRDIYKGLTFWSPNVNIFRDPRWGRGQETYGEDPYLTASLGLQFVKGLQGEGETLKAAACAKHFAAHSGPEAVRHQFDARVSEKDLNETYLPAFETLVKEGRVEAVMGAYNRVNGEPACGSETLLKKILREKWGFQGHVVSDCWAISDFHNFHHVTDTAPESAALAMQNGCDVNCGNTYLHILEALKEGLVTEDQIRLAATRLMATRFRLGLFGKTPFDDISPLENDTDAHDARALKAAEKGMVLLKNDGLLPLSKKKIKTIAVIGPNADSRAALYGNYAGASSRYVTYLEGVRAYMGDSARVLYAVGSALMKDRIDALAQQNDRLAEAVCAAKNADVAIVVLGLDATVEGEAPDDSNGDAAGDKQDLELPACQRALLDAVIQTGTPVITILAVGSALRVTEGNAILWAGYAGQAGGTALCRLLFGEVSPSGRLPVTFYRDVSELLPFEDYAMAGRTYRYFTGEALYPFGFGLSYTRFAYKRAAYRDGKVFVTLQNVGDRAGDEVAQVYVKPENSPFAPPNASLCGYKRVSLEPGEEREIEIALSGRAFTVVNDEGERISGGEKFTLYVGGGQPDARTRALTDGAGIALCVQQ